MELFARCDREPNRLLAVTEAGRRYTLEDLNTASWRLSGVIGGHRLVFVLCQNGPGALLSYLGCLRCGAVPLLLEAGIAPGQLSHLLEVYRPAFLSLPKEAPSAVRQVLADLTPALEVEDSILLRSGKSGPELHPELALLLTTSGSIGSPKLVRLTGRNLDANARSIVEYLGLTEEERPITSLPMSYSYGMSILNTHLMAGAPVLLTCRTVLEREFWTLVEREGVTSLSGVPYTYQMYRRAGLMERALPHLTTLTQAGGKLPEALHQEFSAWADRTGRRFFVMYGQTEAAPRMGYLPAEQASDKCGSMGLPVPGGAFRLIREDGTELLEPEQAGELVYQGPNVAMGYARQAEDLRLGDQWGGVLHTGDIAWRDGEGYYYITGRKKRFLKLYGNRVNLDEVERMLAEQFSNIELACVGRDDLLTVFYVSNGRALSGVIRDFLGSKLSFPPRFFDVRAVEALPKAESGKVQYGRLEDLRFE